MDNLGVVLWNSKEEKRGHTKKENGKPGHKSEEGKNSRHTPCDGGYLRDTFIKWND